MEESSDPTRPRSIDWAGTVLIGAILAPFILAVTEGSDWGWTSPAVLACFAVTVVATVAFVAVERRVAAPLVDLTLLRNALLVAATVGILIGSGTINGLGFLVSIYFQDPSILDMSALEAGLATLPMTVALVVVAPLVVPLAARIGTRTVIAAGFALSTAGFLFLVFVQPSWTFLRVRASAHRGGRGNGAVQRPVRVDRDHSPSRRIRSVPRPGSRTWPATSVPRRWSPSRRPSTHRPAPR